MNFFYLSPSDRVWLKRWLMKHALLLLLIGCFWGISFAWPKTEKNSSPVRGLPDRPQASELMHAADTAALTGSGLRSKPAMAWVEDGPQAIQLVALPMTWARAAESRAAESRAAESRAAESSVRRLPSVVGSATAVQPTGWRRTRNGWENTANWRPALASLGEIVRQQQEREPGWVSRVLARVRSVPPWGVALLQLIVVAGILIFERWAAAHRSPQTNRPEA